MIRFTGGNGTSLKNAMIILGAQNEEEGVAAEYDMIRRCFGIIEKEYMILRQEIYHVCDQSYDRIEMQDENGFKSEIWFDITDFYGKWQP